MTLACYLGGSERLSDFPNLHSQLVAELVIAAKFADLNSSSIWVYERVLDSR